MIEEDENEQISMYIMSLMKYEPISPNDYYKKLLTRIGVYGQSFVYNGRTIVVSTYDYKLDDEFYNMFYDLNIDYMLDDIIQENNIASSIKFSYNYLQDQFCITFQIFVELTQNDLTDVIKVVHIDYKFVLTEVQIKYLLTNILNNNIQLHTSFII